MKNKPTCTRGVKLLGALTLLIAATHAPATLAEDDYYRWIDDQGETIISDRPPAPGIEYEIVSTRSSLTKKVFGGRGEEGGETTEDTAAKVADANSRKDPEMCKRARDNLEALTSSDKVTMRNEEGELKMLSSEEVAQNIETTQGHIQIFCE